MSRIEFIASLPPIQSAITLDGMGDGGRVKLDVSRQYVNALLQLQRLAGQSLKISIETMNKHNGIELEGLESVRIDG